MMRATRCLGVRLFACVAIPIPLRAIGTDGVMGDAGGAPPIMIAVGFFCQNRIAIDTEATAVVAITVDGKRLFAGRTIPFVCTMRIRRIRLLTGFAKPIICRARLVHRMMLFAPGTCPEMVAVFVRREDFTARFADAVTVDVGIRTGVFLLISRAVPGMFAESIQSEG